jgi:phosphoribosylformylglycinamidine synthase
MRAVAAFAGTGGAVVGICNGFQVLCEAGLLPGRLVGNASGRFVCRDVRMRVEGRPSVITQGLPATVRLPVAHGAGRWEADPEVRTAVEARGGIVLRYVGAPPAGCDVAGVCNEAGNVVGLMPHPERHVEAALGGTDGRLLLASLLGARPRPGAAAS